MPDKPLPPPRARSVRKANSGEITPITSHGVDSGEQQKVDHYAYMARLIHSAVESLVSNEPAITTIQRARTINSLNTILQNALSNRVLAAWNSPEFADIAAHLEPSQAERVEHDKGLNPTIELSILAGASTYVDSVDGTYTALLQAFGSEVAAYGDHSSIPDRLSKLNIAQFIPYKGVYLDRSSTIEPHNNLAAFLDQLEPGRTGGWQFKAGYPGEAFVTFGSTLPQSLWQVNNFRLQGTETLKVKDIPTNGATIGCPFSFDPEQGRILWSLYAETRRQIDLHRNPGVVAISDLGDSEGSTRATG